MGVVELYKEKQKKEQSEGKKTPYYGVKNLYYSSTVEDVAKDIYNRTTNWLKNNENYIANFRTRYSGNNETYKKDADDWLSTVTTQNQNFISEANSLKSLLSEYNDYLDPEFVKQITDALDGNLDIQSKIVENVTLDRDYWKQWDSEASYNQWHANEKSKQLIMGEDGFEDYYKAGEQQGLSTQEKFFLYGGTDGKTITMGSDVNNKLIAFRNNRNANGVPVAIAIGAATGNGNSFYINNKRELDAAQYMTDDEYKIYCYYIGKGETAKANGYLSSLEDTITQRKAGAIAQTIKDHNLEWIAWAAVGLDQWVSGVKNLDNFIMGTEADPTTAIQYAGSIIREDIDSKFWQGAWDLGVTVSNQLPSILVGSVTGGAGGLVTMGASVLGNSYAEMRNLGYNEWQARGYATLVTAAEVGLQYAIGGITKLGGKLPNGVVEKFASGVDNAIAKIAIRYGGSMASEGFEEALQSVLEPMFKSWVSGEKYDVDWSEVWYSGILGALSAGVLESVPSVVGGAIEANTIKRQGESFKNNGGDVNRLATYVKEHGDTTFAASSVAKRLAGKVNENTNAYQLGLLLKEVGAVVTEQNKADIVRFLERKGIRTKDAKKLANTLAAVAAGYELTAEQKIAFNADEKVSKTMKDVIENENSTVNQRMAAYNEAIKMVEPENASQTAEVAKVTDSSVEGNIVSEDGSEEVSEARTTYNGEAVEIAGISSIKDGNVIVRLNNGSEVNVRDVDFKNEKEALVYEAVANMNEKTAIDFIEGFNNGNIGNGQSISFEQYLRGFNEAYMNGLVGMPANYVSKGGFAIELSEEQRKLAYQRGRIDGATKVKDYQKAKDEQRATVSKAENVEKKKGKVFYDSINKKTLTSRQKASIKALEKVAEALGVDIHLFESEVNEKGEHIGENGSYDPTTNTIRIDIHAGVKGEGLMLFTAAHELTHFIKEWSPAKFKVFADFLLEQYATRGVPVETLIQDQIKKGKKRWEGKTESEIYELAYEELIADSCEAMLTDSNALEKLALLRNKDKGLFNKIKKFIADLVANIKKVYKGLKPDSEEANYVRDMVDAAEKLQALWTEALLDAGEAYSTTSSDGNIDLDGNENVHFSDRSMIEGAGLQFIANANGVYKVLDKNGKPVKSVTAEQIVNSPLGNLVTMAKNEGFLGKGKEATLAAKKQYEFLAELVNMCINYNGLAPIWETAGTMVFSSMKSNADKQYGLTIDFSTVCKKTQAIVDAMSEAMLRLGRGLTRKEVETIYLEVGKAGESTPCPVCYVFSRWMGIGGILDQISQFQDKYSPMSEKSLQKFIADIQARINERANTPDKNGKLKSKFFNAKGEVSEGQVIAELKNKASSKAASALNAIAKNSDIKLEIQELEALMENQTSKEAKKTAKKIDKLKNKLADVSSLEKEVSAADDELEEYEAYQWLTRTLMTQSEGKWVKNSAFKPVPKEILFDLNKGDKFAEGYPLSWAFRTGKGASAGKAIVPYADARVGEAIQAVANQSPKDIKIGLELNPFLNADTAGRLKILKSAIVKQARQNLVGGQRYQSTSDFRYEYGSDYLITFLEMQAIGAKVQLYTKVIEAVDFLASMGADINLSVMPLSDGFIILPNGEKKLVYSSVTGIDAKAAIEMSHKYNNVQLILVGISDEHIRLALEGTDVTFVIPFHGSGNSVHQIQALMKLLNENLDVTTAQDYTAVQSDHVSPNQTKEQKAMWDLRVKIVQGKASKLTAAEQAFLDKNAYLKDLYRRFYLDQNAEEYGVGLTSGQAEQIFPYEYWDKSLTYAEADKNGERFKEYCASMGIIPRFSGKNSKGEDVGFGNFTNDKGYWKLLIDRPMYDNTYDADGNWTGYGKYHVQQRINCSNFKVEHIDPEYGSATFGDVMSKANDPKKTNKIVDAALAQFGKDTKYSDRGNSWRDVDKIQGLESYTVEEVSDIVRQHIENLAMDMGEEISIIDIRPYGSRARGTAKKTSDLDVVVQYEGDIREDDMFNMLNDDADKLVIDGIEIDINPIKADDTGTVEEYLDRVYSYDKYSETKFSDRDSEGNTLSKEQQEYFKDSKVRDKDGNLIPMYHGTHEKFTVFDISKTSDINKLGKGHYFTSSLEDANKHYTKAGGNQSEWNDTDTKIESMAYDLFYERGYDYEDSLTSDPEIVEILDECYRQAEEYYSEKNATLMSTYLNLKNPLFVKKGEEVGSVLSSVFVDSNNKIVDINTSDILNSEYDGIIDTTVAESFQGVPKGTIHVVAFDSNQIKNTTNKTPTSNPDIRYSDREVAPIADADYAQVEKHFGVTKNYEVAGYMLKNGKMLDFSGKHWGDDYSTSRQVDHRDIQEVLEDRGNNGVNAMIDMISNGNIRLMPETGGINLAVMPNEVQINQLRGYINHFRGEIIIDIDEVGGDTIHSWEYNRGTSSAKILSDIKAYFETGTIPQQQSSLNQFRYSDRDGKLSDFPSIDEWFESLSIEELNELIRDEVSIKDISEELNVEPQKIKILFRRKGLGESHIEENRTAVMKQARLDEAIEDSGAKFNPDYARKYITRISTKDFIDLTVSQDHIDRGQFDTKVMGDHGSTMSDFDYEKALQDSQSPYLHIDRSTGRIIGHNGRHRIRALEKAGIESVEIEVQFFDEEGYLIKYNANTIPDMAISSQFDTAIETHLSSIIPLNEAHRAEVEKTYGEKAHANAGVRYSDRDYENNEFIKAVKAEVVDLKNTGGWSGKHLKELYRTHPELDFIKRIDNVNIGDTTAIKELKDLVSTIDDSELLDNLLWYPIYARDSQFRGIYRKAINAYKKVINNRIKELLTKTNEGKDIGMEIREYNLSEIRDIFNSLNTNQDVSNLADKVFKVAESLNLEIKGVRSIDQKKGVLGESSRNQIIYRVPFFNDTTKTDQEKAGVLLHEVIHACTTYAIRAVENPNRDIDITNGMRKAVNILKNVYEQINRDVDFKGEYGLKSVYEMVAELSNPEFREKLQKKNLWEKIVDAIKRIFGIETKTTFDGVSSALDYILDNFDSNAYNDYLRKTDNSRNKLFYEEAVINIATDSELADRIEHSNKSKYSVIRDYLIEKFYGQTFTLSDGIEAIMDKRDAQELAHKADNRKTAALSNLRDIIEKAQFSHKADNVQHGKFDAFRYYSVKVSFDGQVYDILLNVGHSKYQDEYHIYDLTKNKRAANQSSTGLSQPVGDAMKSSSFNKRVAQNPADVNTNTKISQKLSDRDTDSMSNRSLLANALEATVQNDIEKIKLETYKQKIILLNAEERKLQNINKQIRDISFSEGARDNAKLKDLKFEANQIANRINTYDRQLLNLEASKPLKNVLEREKKKAYKKAEQRGKEALDAYRERSAKTTRELMNRYQESRARATEGRHKTEMRHKIKKVVGELNKLLLRPTKDKHVQEDLQKAVAESLFVINMDSLGAEERVARINELIAKETNPDTIADLTATRDRISLWGENLKDKLSALQAAYEKIRNSKDVEMVNAYQEVVLNTIKNVSEMVGDVPIRHMSLEQLEAVYEMYAMVLHVVRASNKAFKAKKGETITQLSESVNDEIRKVSKEKFTRNPITAYFRKIGWTLLKPLTAFRTIGSETFTDMYKELRNGEDTYFVDIDEAKAFIQGTYKKFNYNSWDKKQTKTFTAKSGKTFTLNLEQMMSIYAYSRREQALAHILEGGIVLEDAVIETKKHGLPIKYQVDTKTAFNISEGTLVEIVNSLTNEQKGFVEEMQAYLSDVMGAKGNEVSMELLGIKLFKEKYYFPLKSSKYYMGFKPEEAGEIKLKNSSFSKETVQHANNPVVLQDFTDVWATHINDMSMYHAFVLPLEDFTRVFNYKTKTDSLTETISTEATIANAYGVGATQYIRNFLKSLNGGVRVDGVAISDKMIGLAKKGAVLGSASVIIQQPSAMMRAMALINPIHFATTTHKSLNLVKHKQDWTELKQYAPIAGIKEMGRFDVGMGQTTVKWIKDQNTAMEKVDEALGKAPAFMDEITWVGIWNAVKKETASKHKDLQVDSEAFLKKAGERFTEVVSLTQVYDSVFSRSDIMRNANPVAKMLTAFMAEPTTTLNMLWDAFIQGKRTGKAGGFIKMTAGTGGAVLASIVFNAALKSIIMAMRDDDDDESYVEKYFEHFVGDLKDNLNPLSLIPFVKDIVSIFNGYDVERMDMALFSDLKNAIDAFDSDSKTEYEKWSGLVGAISAFFGVPIKNVERDVRGAYNTIKSFIEGEKTTGAGIKAAIKEGWTGEKTSNAQQLYEAILSGDQAQIDRVKGRFEDQDEINSAIRKALRDNDPRIHEAAQARYNGDIATYMRIAKEIIAEGHFDQDTVVAAINAEINAIKREEAEGTTKEPTEDKADEVTSIFSASDVNAAFENGDTAMAKEVIADLVNTKMANGKTEKEAKASVRSSMTAYWKPLYKAAYQNNDTAEMKRIREILYASGLYGGANLVVETVKGWLKD